LTTSGIIFLDRLAGIVLWACVHATLAGVLLVALIPTRPPPDYKTLTMQADAMRKGMNRDKIMVSAPPIDIPH
jgi:Na+/H+ antiporter NhaA